MGARDDGFWEGCFHLLNKMNSIGYIRIYLWPNPFAN